MTEIENILAAAPLTYSLIIINIIISYYALGNSRFMEHYIFNMSAMTKGKQYYRGMSAAFLHADGMHLFFNMYTLYHFGPAIEEIFGTLGFAILYFGSQIGAKALSLYINRNNMDYTSLGASGAISGILVAFCVVEPTASLGIIFIPVAIPAIVFAAAYIGGSILLMGKKDSRIAHDAHLGGAIAGGLITIALMPELLAI